jgi:hypothetical protein
MPRTRFADLVKDVLALSTVLGVLWAVTVWSAILGSGAL